MKEFTDFFFRNWVLIVILGNFLIALSNIISKVIISGSVSKPLNPSPYTFYSGFGGVIITFMLAITNIWLNFLRMGFSEVSLGIAAGLCLILGLWPFYMALLRTEASRVMTLYVGGVPLFTFLLKFLFTSERLNDFQLVAFILLVASGILVSFRRYDGLGLGFKDLVLTITSAFTIALGLVLAETAFKSQGFLSGLTWIGIGYFLASLIVFLWPGQRRKILSTGEYTTKTNVVGFLAEKALGMSGSITIKFALSLVSATLVNAFEGLKQFFVLILAAIISFWRPDILKEELKGAVLWQKIFAAIMVSAGIFLLIFK